MELLWPESLIALRVDQFFGVLLTLCFMALALECADIEWPWTRESWRWSFYKWELPWRRKNDVDS